MTETTTTTEEAPLAPNATNPEFRPGMDPSVQPHQVGETGNPAPKAPEARAPKAGATIGEQEAEAKAEDESTAPEAEATESDDKPLDVAVWGDTGSETGNAVLTLLQNSGVSPEDAKALLWDAVQAGDVTKIDRDALVEKVGKTKAHLIMTGVTGFLGDREAAIAEVKATVHGAVGGEDNWNTIRDWAKTNVKADELADLSDMIDAGGVKARLAAQELKSRYETGNGTLPGENTREAVPNRGAPAPKALEPLTASAYVKQLEALNKEHFGNPPSNLRQALLDARQRGKAVGI